MISGGFGYGTGVTISGGGASQQTPVSTQPGTYQSQLSQAQDSYSDVMQGYANVLGSQQAAGQQIQQGYGQLQGQVAQTLGYGGTPWGVAAPAAQAIQDVYAQQMGQGTQSLINSGLGNTTVLSSVQQGAGLQAQKAYGALGAQLAQTYAGYQSQLGLAGLNYANQLNQQGTQVGLAQLGYQGGYHPQGYSAKPGGGGGGGIGGASTAPGAMNPWGNPPTSPIQQLGPNYPITLDPGNQMVPNPAAQNQSIISGDSGITQYNYGALPQYQGYG